jgi:hypothetical protein
MKRDTIDRLGEIYRDTLEAFNNGHINLHAMLEADRVEREKLDDELFRERSEHASTKKTLAAALERAALAENRLAALLDALQGGSK